MFDYDTQSQAIAVALWEESTGNGAGIDSDIWDSHMQNCHDAVVNAYCEGMSVKQWYAAAKARLNR